MTNFMARSARNFMARSARNFMVIKAAREIKAEIEKAGIDNLKLLAEKGVSIIATYLQGCSPKEQADYRRNFNGLLAMGITPEMILDEVTNQIKELQPIIAKKPAYKQAELQKVREFLKGD